LKAAEPCDAAGVLPTRHDDGASCRKPLPVRAMGADDVAAVTQLRLALLRETGAAADDGHAVQALSPDTEAFFRRSLSSADWQTWVAVAPFDGAVVAIGSLALWQRPPYPGNAAGLDAYLLNMYTAPTHRGQGAARGIAEAALAWARQRGVPKLVLHATPAGRVLYQTLGFTASTAYMELSLGPLA
jgi:GNAT superfamily N-acetyltransferase